MKNNKIVHLVNQLIKEYEIEKKELLKMLKARKTIKEDIEYSLSFYEGKVHALESFLIKFKKDIAVIDAASYSMFFRGFLSGIIIILISLFLISIIF